MPYVSRNKQFSPEYIDGLFLWIDNYNLINSGKNSNLSGYIFSDTTEFNNDIIGTNNIRLSNAKVNFSNYDYAQTSQRLSIPTIPNSFTIFYVGQPGYSKTQNSLVTLFNADSNSIKNSNTIGIVVDEYNIAYATNLQPTSNSLNKYNGAYSIIGNRNFINIFTATFDQNNSQLWVNGITNGVLSSSCSNIFPIGDLYNNILTIQSNNGFYTNNSNWLNSFNEILVYDHIFTDPERFAVEQYLAKKWQLVYPGRSLTGVSAIPGLTNWYNLTNITNMSLNVITGTVISLQINSIYDLSGFSNILNESRSKQNYDSNYKLIIPFRNNIFTNGLYSNYIFTPHILNKGITVSFITTNSFYQKSGINTSNIMTLFSPRFDNLQNSNYPTVKTDGLYNIFAGGNVYSSVNAGNSLFLAKNKFTLSNLNSAGLPTSSNIKELCVITMQFIDYNSYGTTQLFMNGYPMMISCNGPSNWLGSNYHIYYSGIPNIVNNINLSSSPLDLGDTLIYDRVLEPSELSVVHEYLFSSYAISNVISSNGLIGWFDAADYSSSVGTVLNTWNSKGGVDLTLSNPGSTSFALIRNYSNISGQSNLTFIDLNNGAPSYFVNNTTVPMSTYSNLIVFYVVLGNSNLATNGYITSFGHSNGSVTYFRQSNLTNVFGNTSNGVYATTDFSSKPNNQPIITGAYASNSDNNLMRFDTVSQNTMTIGSLRYNGSNISNINIGSYLGTNFCKTQIGEVLIYNRPVGKYEYINIFGYLQSKWCSPTVVPFPTDYVLRYDACNISLNLNNWTSSENKGPQLSLCNYASLGSISFAYFNRPFLSNSIFTQFSNALSINLEKGFTIFTVTSNANTFGNIVSLLNNCNNTLQPNIYLSNTGTSNIFGIGNEYDSENNEGTSINEIYSYTPLNSKSPLINCFKYNPNTSSYSITTKGTTLQVNSNNTYTYTGYLNSNYKFSIGGIGSLNFRLGFDSLIGEVLIYNRPLDDYESELVSANLTEKWNTPLSYPVLFESRTISCNISLSATSLQNNRLTLSNIPVLSNYYNFPMSILFTSVPSLGNPVITGVNPFAALYSNVYGSCNYVVTMSTNNPFGSASLILYSNTTPPGIPRFPADYNAFTVFSTLQITASNNRMLVYSNILLTSILCNDAYGYDRNYKLTIYYTLTSNGENALVGSVTSNQTSNGLYRSNISITFSNLVEEAFYRLTLFASNESGITSYRFSNISPSLGYPFFSNTFSVSQPISYTFSNFTNFTYATLRGATKTRTASSYYVTMRANNIPTTNFTTNLSISAASGSIFSNVSLSLSNLIGMVLYSNITLIASNATGVMPASSALSGSNSLGFFRTPPGPPIFPSQPNLTITCNTNIITYSNVIGPYLSCNSTLYPTGGWGAFTFNNNNSGIFGFYTVLSNGSPPGPVPNITPLGTAVQIPFGNAVRLTGNGTTSGSPNTASNIWFILTGLTTNTTYRTTIYASNISGITSNVFDKITTL